jgi:putative ABC transport system permease protein
MLLIRLLLWLYPSGFRAEYSDELTSLYRERRAATRGPVSVARLWGEAIADVLRVAGPLHVDVLRQDVRFAIRSVRRSPGFALTVVCVAGLGVGANTAAFTVLDTVLVRPLPYAESGALVRVWESPPGYSRVEASPATYRDWVQLSGSFEAMAASTPVSANLVGRGDPVRLEGAAVTSSLFPMLGARPVVGRLFTESDDAESSPATLILGEAIWRNDFGADPGVIGSSVLLDGEPHVVIGVLPSTFRFPNRATTFWRPMRFPPWMYEDRDNNFLTVTARLRGDVTLERARAEMSRIMASLESEYPDSYERTGATVNRLRDEVSSQSRLLLLALSGAAFGVLLIACTNLANLLLARGLMRGRELAVRASLGAGRQRLLRQLLTESIGLALIGGAVGVLAAGVSLPLLSRLVPPSLPAGDTLALDGRVLIFALTITLLTGIGFGAVPAWRASRRINVTELRDGGRSGGLHHAGVRNVLVTVEVAASVALLITSGLLIRALAQLQSVDPGFNAETVVTMRTWLPLPEYQETRRRGEFYERVVEEVTALPGVQSAAYSSFLPIAEGGGIWPVEIDGQLDVGEFPTASLRFVTPRWFETLEIPIVLGRDVRASDTFDQPFVAVVSESFARRHWPDRDPIGQTFTFAFFERSVVGVVGNVSMRGLERLSEPQVWLPYLQAPDGGVPRYAPKDLAVRTRNDPLAIVPAIREIVRRVDPRQPVSDVRLLDDIVAGDTAPRRVQLRLVGAFTAIAFLLAAIGLHGLLSFTASRRSHEIGVRLALGARRSSILRLVAHQAAVPAGAGILIGGFIGYAAGLAMQGLLAGIPPADAPTFAAAITLGLVMAVAGSLQPAVRAARIDPATVMREGGG